MGEYSRILGQLNRSGVIMKPIGVPTLKRICRGKMALDVLAAVAADVILLDFTDAHDDLVASLF